MDPIGDMLTQIRNSQAVGHRSCLVRFSKIREEILKILKEEGYIRDFKIEERDNKKNMRVFISYDKGGGPTIKSIRRISKPGRRVYCNKDKLPIVLKGMGMAIVSTSRGIMTNKKAKKENVGGEVICEVW